MSNSHKRKREFSELEEADHERQYLLSLEAHEAMIQPALHQQEIKLSGDKQGATHHAGLIEWEVEGPERAIWVDRYDARLLLESLPASLTQSNIGHNPADGWDDLPSDSEDLFFFSLDEAEELRRKKKRRRMDDEREARLSALRAQESEEHTSERWGGSDEEPNESQMALMKKTAAHIAASPNPVQFELRILANHGTDERFAFLRGRWKRAWKDLKTPNLDPPKSAVSNTSMGLVSYADSDGEGDEPSHEGPGKIDMQSASNIVDEADLKAQRLARVKEWSRKRKEAKARAQSPVE